MENVIELYSEIIKFVPDIHTIYNLYMVCKHFMTIIDEECMLIRLIDNCDMKDIYYEHCIDSDYFGNPILNYSFDTFITLGLMAYANAPPKFNVIDNSLWVNKNIWLDKYCRMGALGADVSLMYKYICDMPILPSRKLIITVNDCYKLNTDNFKINEIPDAYLLNKLDYLIEIIEYESNLLLCTINKK